MFSLRFAFLLSLDLLVAGCGSVPSFDNLNGKPITASPNVAELVTHIQCEILRVKQQAGFSKLDTQRYVAFAQLTVDVTNLEGTAPSLNFIHPYLAAMTNLTYSIGGQFTGTQHRNMTQAFSIDLHATPDATKCPDKNKEGSRLAGDLGLEAIIRDGLENSEDDKFVFKPPGGISAGVNQTTVPVFGSTVDFTIVYGLSNVGPTWTLTRFKGPGGGSGGGGAGGGGAGGASAGMTGGGGGGSQGLLTLTRTNKDTLIISFAPVCSTSAICPPPKPPSEATHVPDLPNIVVPQTNLALLEPSPRATPAERLNFAAAQSLQSTTTALTTALNHIQALYVAQIQATDALRVATATTDETIAAVRAAQDNNTRMLLQNLLNP